MLDVILGMWNLRGVREDDNCLSHRHVEYYRHVEYRICAYAEGILFNHITQPHYMDQVICHPSLDLTLHGPRDMSSLLGSYITWTK